MDCVIDKVYINFFKKWIFFQYMGFSVFVWRFIEVGGIFYVGLVVEGYIVWVQVQVFFVVYRLIQRSFDRSFDIFRYIGVQ